MKIFITVFFTFCCILLFSQKVTAPKYIFVQDFKNTVLKTLNNPFFIEYKQVVYIGKLSKKININYESDVNSDYFSSLLKQHYRKKDFEVLNCEFKEGRYENFVICADVLQQTPLLKMELDTLKMSDSVVFLKIDSLQQAGISVENNIPYKENYYEGFPITIYNFGQNERIIGFGNNVRLELEALDRANTWQTVTGIRKYACGNGIFYFVLKSEEIATVLVPRLKGNFKTKFRYRFGNVLSNEFEGTIDEKYINKN